MCDMVEGIRLVTLDLLWLGLVKTSFGCEAASSDNKNY